MGKLNCLAHCRGVLFDFRALLKKEVSLFFVRMLRCGSKSLCRATQLKTWIIFSRIT
jgi:hypothetical protein